MTDRPGNYRGGHDRPSKHWQLQGCPWQTDQANTDNYRGVHDRASKHRQLQGCPWQTDQANTDNYRGVYDRQTRQSDATTGMSMTDRQTKQTEANTGVCMIDRPGKHRQLHIQASSIVWGSLLPNTFRLYDNIGDIEIIILDTVRLYDNIEIAIILLDDVIILKKSPAVCALEVPGVITSQYPKDGEHQKDRNGKIDSAYMLLIVKRFLECESKTCSLFIITCCGNLIKRPE